MLIPTRYFHPFAPLYEEKALDVVKKANFKKNVDRVAEVVAQTMTKLGIEVETS